MRMKLALAATLAAGLNFLSVARATSLGISSDPAGGGWDRGQPGTAHAAWDSFPSFTFSGDAPDSSGNLTSPGLSQSVTLLGTVPGDQGAGIYNNLSIMDVPGTDIYYGGARAGNFSATATSPFPLKQVYLQIKRVASEAGFAGAIVPTLNGVGFDSVTNRSGGGDTTHDSGLWSVTTWYWGAALDSQMITNVNIAFTIPMHRGIDGIVLDTAAVPEPAALVLAGIGAIVSLGRRRRS